MLNGMNLLVKILNVCGVPLDTGLVMSFLHNLTQHSSPDLNDNYNIIINYDNYSPKAR